MDSTGSVQLLGCTNMADGSVDHSLLEVEPQLGVAGEASRAWQSVVVGEPLFRNKRVPERERQEVGKTSTANVGSLVIFFKVTRYFTYSLF